VSASKIERKEAHVGVRDGLFMKTLPLITAILIATSATAVWAQSVGTDASQQRQSGQERRLEDSQSIQIKKSQAKRDTKGTQHRQERNDAAASELSGSLTRQVSIGKLFFPFFVELEGVGTELKLYPDQNVSDEERREANRRILEAQVRTDAMHPETLAHYRGVSPAYIAQYCRIFSTRAYTWGQYQGVVTTTQENRLTHKRVYQWEEPAVVRTPLTSVWNTPGGIEMFGPPQIPSERMYCLIAYATVIERAARQLADGARVTEDKFSGARVFALPELSKQASYAFWESMADTIVADEIDARYSDLRYAAELCLVPTPNGLQQGRTNVICGEYDYDQNAHVLMKGGVRFLSDDSINGVKVVFAEVKRESQTTSTSKSKASFVSNEASKESGQELAVAKRKSATLESGTKNATGSRSDLSANPK
jgi:hypothetical protein